MATSPPTKVLPTAPAGSSGWVLEAKGKDPGSLNISRDISTGANQSITVRPGTQFRMKPSGKSKVDKGAETAETAKWGDDLLVTVPGGGQVLLKGFYNKSPNAPPSKMVIEQKMGCCEKLKAALAQNPRIHPILTHKKIKIATVLRVAALKKAASRTKRADTDKTQKKSLKKIRKSLMMRRKARAGSFLGLPSVAAVP